LLQLQRKMIIAAFAGLLTGADGISGGHGGPGVEQQQFSNLKDTDRRESTIDHEFQIPTSTKYSTNESNCTADITTTTTQNPMTSNSFDVEPSTVWLPLLDKCENNANQNANTANLSTVRKIRSLEIERSSDLCRNESLTDANEVRDDLDVDEIAVDSNQNIQNNNNNSNAPALSTSSVNLKSVEKSEKKSKTVNFLRKLKASALSRTNKSKNASNVLSVSPANQPSNNVNDTFLCLEEISSDGPSYGSNR
jgi:hypothetical protein